MSNKSGVASQVIPLPQGGGAVRGIGETFSPDLFTGTGNITVPIAVPAGRNGLQPTLNLVYSTGNGNGPFGLGWDVSVPRIARKTSRGIPRYRDDAADPGEHDTFVLSGAEDLVPVGQPAAGVTRFRPRTEGLFARIERLRQDGDRWRVRGRDGLVSQYGTAGGGAAVVADPGQPAKIFSWLLNETTDPFGNRVEYTYLSDPGSDGPHQWDQRYLERVRYVDYEQGGQRRFLVSVTFRYEQRPDPCSDHRAGFEIRTRLRCQRIEVRTHPGDQDLLVRTYELTYVDERVRAGELDPAELPANGVSLLSRIRMVGHDGDDTEALPPLEFGYSRFAPEGRRPRRVEGTHDTLPHRSLADDDLELVDLFGNGLPDLIQMNGATRFWRNLGNGRFDVPRTMTEIPAGVQLREPGTQLADMNGDGRADLLVLSQRGYFPLSFAGRWSPQGFVRYRSSPSLPLGDGNLRLVDLDGDGVVDALRTGARFELYFNDPVEGWDATETRPRGPLAEFPDVTFADSRVKLADLSGDGLQDIVLVEQGRVQYWPYLGHGRWGRRITMAESPVFQDPLRPPGGFDGRRVLLGDVDGDGLDDLIYVEPDRITVWINQSGNGWSRPITLTGTPRFPDADAVRVVDMLGTGTAGILWTSDAPGRHQFADLTGGVKPYLIAEMDNHQGARTRIRYASSTEFYLGDAADPATRWLTPLPFPVPVVADVEVIDEISGGRLTTRYRYRHGYWDGAEREFRGFGRVEQLDTEDFDRAEPPRFAPPLLTRTWFHLGPVGDEFAERGEAAFDAEYWSGDPAALDRPAATEDLLRSLPAAARADALRSLRGHVLRTELYAVDGSPQEGRPYTVTEAQYGIREEDPPAVGAAGRRRIFFPHQVAERTTLWERGAEPMHRFGFTDSYDRYGMPGRVVSLAVPRGRDFRTRAAAGAEPYLGTSTVIAYARRDDDSRYLVDRVARTTTYEIRNDGSVALVDLLDGVRSGTARLAVSGQTLTYYDGPAFVGLPVGEVGEFGVPVRAETLVLTEAILAQAYRAGAGPDAPPYLAPGGPPAWTGDYPQPFRDGLPTLAGYVFSTGDRDRERGYFVTVNRQRYDFHDSPARTGRGLPTTSLDPLGRPTTVEYDRFGLLPVAVTDAAALTTRVEYDHRVLQPRLVTDPNGNRRAYAFTPLGLLASTAVMGKAGERTGDAVSAPSTRLVYEFARTPISVRTVRRVHHINDTEVPAGQRDETIETVEYSDGFGRLVQTRTQAEEVTFGDPAFGGNLLPAGQGDPADRRAVTGRRSGTGAANVVVSGWQVYDNKGRVIERYEPFFATGWDYRPPVESQLGQRMRMFHDPRGQVIRTRYPDGSEQRVCYGVPADLAEPERVTPTPWEAYTYDRNDNGGRTHPGEAGGYVGHWDTPTSVVIDALGRTVQSTQRHRPPPASPDAPLPPVEEFRTRSSYDIRGNLLAVVDAAGRTAARHVYDLTGRPLRADSIDAGLLRTIVDAAGAPVEQRDGRGTLILHGYDALARPVRLWARDDAGSGVTLREHVAYGDGGDPEQPAPERAASGAANRLGLPHLHYDEAGLSRFGRYDHKGNLLDKSRQVIADEAILAVFPARDDPAPDWRVVPFRVDWQPPPGTTLAAHAGRLLEPTGYEVSTSYDALGRVRAVRYPRDVAGGRSELRPEYNRAGALERVNLDGQVFIAHIGYDAKGQRTLVAFGNGVLTRYAHHPRTLRLTRLRSERYTSPAALTYQPTGQVLQDLAYQHDLVGNILGLVDRTPGCGVAANPGAGQISDPELRALVAHGDALVRTFGYDPLYRLVSATGRECTGGAGAEPWADLPRCGFNSADHASPNQANAPDLTGVYRETYRYDRVGNLVRLQHTAGDARSVRQFRLVPGTNRLQALTAGATTFTYTHDAAGNLTDEAETRHFEWDRDHRMMTFRTQAGTAEPSIHAQYLYGAGGERVKKLVRRQGGGVEVTICIDGTFEVHRWSGTSASPAGTNNRLAIMDGQDRLGVVRTGDPHPEDRGPAVQYHLGDHLGSSSVVLDTEGRFVNREEYSPYGETTFGGFARKRYRFTGRERDEESRLYRHGARYYAPWLGRWTSADPAGLVDGPNLYRYVRGNPVRLTDASGTQPDDDPTAPPTLSGVGVTISRGGVQVGPLGPPAPGPCDELNPMCRGGSPQPEGSGTDLLHGVKSYAPPPAKAKDIVWRKTNPRVDPEPFGRGFTPGDPNARWSPGEHALNQHGTSEFRSVPDRYKSASYKPGGATTMTGEAIRIDARAAQAAGATFYDTPDILRDMDRLAGEGKVPSTRVESWKRAQQTLEGVPVKPGEPLRGEVLFEGHVPGKAVVTGTRQALKYVGRGLGAAGTVLTAWDLGKSIVESVEQDSIRPFVREVVRQAATWGGVVAGYKGGALAGGKLGVAIGSAFGPAGALVGGIVGAAVGGVAGYVAGSWLADLF